MLQAVLILGRSARLSLTLLVASGCSSKGGDEGVSRTSSFAQVQGCACASSQASEWFFWAQGGFMALASALWGVSRSCLSQKRSRSVNSAWELQYTKLNLPGILPGHGWCMLATE